MTFKYPYIKQGEVQYPNLNKSTIVEARYRQCYGIDKGNPLIEALPSYSVSEEEAFRTYFRPCLAGKECVYGLDVPKSDRMNQVLQLENLRIPPDYACDLDMALGQALTTSYRKRFASLKPDDGSVNVGDLIIPKVLGYGDCNDGDLGTSGVALIGPTGCGKTSAKKLALAKYPTHIIHEFEGYGTYHQIVYLNAECPANSDLSTLFNTFGEALDRTLGNKTPWFATLMRKVSGVQAKVAYLCRLIEDFSIGALIIDECEHLNFKANSKTSYDAFITLINNTRVSIILVGQSEAIESMTGNAQVKRRIGTTLNAGYYCHNFGYFRLLVNEVVKYSWRTDENGKLFSPPLTDDECRVLYSVCSGTISMLVKTWILVQQYGIRNDRWPKLTYEFVSGLLGKKSPGLEQELRLKVLSDPLNLENHNPLMLTAIPQDRFMNMPKPLWALRAKATLPEKQTGQDEAGTSSLSITEEVKMIVSEYNESNGRKWADETIDDMIKKISCLKCMKEATVSQIAEKCIARLMNKSDRRSSSGKSISGTRKSQNAEMVEIGEGILKKSLDEDTSA